MKNQEIKFNNKNSKYSILIGKNALNELPAKLKSLCPNAKNAAIILDKKIPSGLWARTSSAELDAGTTVTSQPADARHRRIFLFAP